ncbi:type II toxin-antitoxin system VapC family toxin [Nocardia sp. NPDC047654]|uniref:type II toxin-antitoxin system VapC family toxin n=1 Tax=Nocardia sp. NPDC047654 TaxID=3364314 RepID=UPI003724AF3B
MIVCDTGPLVAVLNKNDADHRRCLDLLETHPGPLLVPGPVLAEVCYFLETRVGPSAEARFLESIANEEIELVDLTPGRSFADGRVGAEVRRLPARRCRRRCPGRRRTARREGSRNIGSPTLHRGPNQSPGSAPTVTRLTDEVVAPPT